MTGSRLSRLLLASVAVLLVSAFGAAASANASRADSARTISAVDSLEQSVLAEINAVRARHRLTPLRSNVRLVAAADVHSLDMASRGYFAHTSASGTSFWKRIAGYYRSQGYRYWTVGENLAFTSGHTDARTVVQMWLDSPPHRKNLLSPLWREIGLSAVHATAAPGVFAGLDVTVVTADFGARRTS